MKYKLIFYDPHFLLILFYQYVWCDFALYRFNEVNDMKIYISTFFSLIEY